MLEPSLRRMIDSGSDETDLPAGEIVLPAGLSLVSEPEGLTLEGDGLSLRGDFAKLFPRIKTNNLNGELVVRAARGRKRSGRGGDPRIILDATAGLGEDSFLLAAAGFTVELYERDPAIAALLADALRRGKKDPALSEIVSRMHFHEGDSLEVLTAKGEKNDAPFIIFLDPMFPARGKSAQVKKKFQLLHHLESPCAEEEKLLQAALRSGAEKVIVKRPAGGPYLAGVKPSYSLTGKAVRMDVLIPAGLIDT